MDYMNCLTSLWTVSRIILLMGCILVVLFVDFFSCENKSSSQKKKLKN